MSFSTNFHQSKNSKRMVEFPFPHNSLPVAGAECPAAHDRGCLLDDPRVVQVPRSALSECVALKRLFLSASEPAVTFSQQDEGMTKNSLDAAVGHLNPMKTRRNPGGGRPKKPKTELPTDNRCSSGKASLPTTPKSSRLIRARRT
jgi:hypothetical protein